MHYYNPIGTELNVLRRPIERENLPASVFGRAGDEARSDRYCPVPTIDVVDRLAAEGWYPVSATENSRAKNKGFQKHQLRFAQDENIRSLKVGDELVEAVLTNSLDGTTKFQLAFGLYRPVCSNGMIVCESMFSSVSFKHRNLDVNAVVNSVVNMTQDAGPIAERVLTYKSIKMDHDDRRRFATAARNIRFGEESEFDPELLLTHRRTADEGTDLWTVFNVVQENCIKGGIKDYRLEKSRRTRALANITQNNRVNKDLFGLADDFSEKLQGREVGLQLVK